MTSALITFSSIHANRFIAKEFFRFTVPHYAAIGAVTGAFFHYLNKSIRLNPHQKHSFFVTIIGGFLYGGMIGCTNWTILKIARFCLPILLPTLSIVEKIVLIALFWTASTYIHLQICSYWGGREISLRRAIEQGSAALYLHTTIFALAELSLLAKM